MVETRPDVLAERRQLVVLVHCETHEGDEVGEQPLRRRTPDPVLVQCLVGAPELLGRPGAGRRLDFVGQRLEVAEAETPGVRRPVEALEGIDLVLVVRDEPLERVDQRLRLLLRRLARSRLDQLVHGDVVDDLLQPTLDVLQEGGGAQVWWRSARRPA